MSTDVDPNATVEECDEILRRYAGATDDPEVRKLVAYTMTRKAWSLESLGNQRDAAALYTEIIDRLSDSDDPEIRQQAIFALSRRARGLMRRADGLDQAIELTDQLLNRLWEEPPQSLEFLADTCISVARMLLIHPQPSPVALLLFGGEAGINAISGYATSAWSSLSEPTRNRLRIDGIETVERLIPGTFARQRRRSRQALKLCTAVRARLGEDDARDLAPLLTRASVTAAGAHLNLGRVEASLVAFASATAGQNPDAVQAFQRLADEQAGRHGFAGTLSLLGYLRHRAESLVGEEPALARIAYDDSVDARLPQPRGLLLRLAVRLLRP